MLLIPLQTKPGIYDLFIVLLEDNMKYLRRGHPEPVTKDMIQGVAGMNMENAWIRYATGAEVEHIMFLSADAGNPAELIKFLLRGLQKEAFTPQQLSKRPILN